MTCEEIQQLLPSYVTCALEADQVALVRAHIHNCPDCLLELNETKRVFEFFSGSLTPMKPPPQIKQKLMAAVRHAPVDSIALPRRGRLLYYAMAACIGLIVGGLGVYFATPNPAPDRSRQLQEALAERDAHIDQLNHLLSSSQLSLVEMTSQKSAAHGHILYDPTNHHWRIYVFDLQPPPANHVYELWAITKDNKKLPAGTFVVDAHGNAEYSGEVPGNLVAAAITDEPAPGTMSPTGSIHLLGKING